MVLLRLGDMELGLGEALAQGTVLGSSQGWCWVLIAGSVPPGPSRMEDTRQQDWADTKWV